MSVSLAEKILGGKSSANKTKSKTVSPPKKSSLSLAQSILSKPSVPKAIPTPTKTASATPMPETQGAREKLRKILMTPVPSRVIDIGGGVKEVHMPTGAVYRQDATGKPVQTPRDVSESAKKDLRGGKSFQDTQTEIDHLMPKALGGTDDDTQLRALKDKKTLVQSAYDFITGNKRLPGEYTPANRQEGKMVVEWEAINQYKAGKINIESARAAVQHYDNPDFVGSMLGQDFAKHLDPTERDTASPKIAQAIESKVSSFFGDQSKPVKQAPQKEYDQFGLPKATISAYTPTEKPKDNILKKIGRFVVPTLVAFNNATGDALKFLSNPSKISATFNLLTKKPVEKFDAEEVMRSLGITKDQVQLSEKDLQQETESSRQNYLRQKEQQKNIDTVLPKDAPIPGKSQKLFNDLQSNPGEDVGFVSTLSKSVLNSYYSQIRPTMGTMGEILGNFLGSARMKEWGIQTGDAAIAHWMQHPELLPGKRASTPLTSGGYKDPIAVANTIGSTIPYMTMVMGSSLVGGLVAGPAGAYAGAFASSATGESTGAYREMISQGIAPDKASSASLIYGSVSAMIENAMGFKPSGIAKKMLGQGAKQSAEEVVATSFKDFLKKELPKLPTEMLKKMAEEGEEEGIQQLAQNLITKWQDESQDVWEGVAESVAQGAIASIGFIPFEVSSKVREYQPNGTQKKEAPSMDPTSNMIDRGVQAVQEKLKNGDSPQKIVLDLSKDMDIDTAKMLTIVAAQKISEETKAQEPQNEEPNVQPTENIDQTLPTEATVKTEDQTGVIDQQATEASPEPKISQPSPLASVSNEMVKLGDKIIERTPAYLQKDFMDHQDKLESSISEAKVQLNELKQRAIEAVPEEQTQVQAQVDTLTKQIQDAETQSNEEFSIKSAHLRSRIRDRVLSKYPNAPEEKVTNVIDQVADAITDPENLKHLHHRSIGNITDVIAKESLKNVEEKTKPVEEKPVQEPVEKKKTGKTIEKLKQEEADLNKQIKRTKNKVEKKLLQTKLEKNAKAQTLLESEKNGISNDEPTYEPDNDSRDLTRSKDDAEPVQDSPEQPDGTGGTASEPGQSQREEERSDVDSSLTRERLATRLTNEDVDNAVSSITRVNEDGTIELIGEITEEIKEAANQYQTGGKTKEGRGILDEYYTNSTIVDMVKSLFALPEAPLKVLEPSAGSGNFLYILPEGIKHDIQAMEINPISAKIAKIFHPDSVVQNKPFESLFIDKTGKPVSFKGDYDLIVGNPPYGDHRGIYKGLGEEKDIGRYEEYFIKRGLDLLKEGGHLAMVIPSGFLRGADSKVKKMIAGSGKLMSAWRLPNGVFEGTDIGTDIVVFEKRKAPMKADETSRASLLSKDAYFEANPSQILGNQKERKGKFGMEAYVEGTIDDAITNFHLNLHTREALSMLKKIDVEPTLTNVENAKTAIEEAGQEKARALIKKEEGKQTIKNVIKQATSKKSKVISLISQFNGEFTDDEIDHWKATKADGSIDTALLSNLNPEITNQMNGKSYIDFNYLQGDIYEKLDILEQEKGKMSDEQYARQKAKLESVLPKQEKAENILLDPSTQFVKTLETKDEEGKTITLKDGFLKWLDTLPSGAYGQSSRWEVSGYVKEQQVRGNDKEMNEAVRTRRKEVASRLFNRYIKDGLSNDQKIDVEDAYNRSFNFFHIPDYTKVPMFSDIHSTYEGHPFILREVQKHGIGRLVNTGGGVLAHEVGFGKTLQGIIAIHETMTRGWAKRPLIVVPSDQILKQWIHALNEVIPNAKINNLGNLGAAFVGDIGSLKIEEGSWSFSTYEGLERLSFKDETYKDLSSHFHYISDDLNDHLSNRQKQQRQAKLEETEGKMRRGTRADTFFEDLGFDHFTADEVHNMNHIVAKVKLEKGQASEFNQFSQRPSEIGLKAWMSAKYIQSKNEGRNVNLLSATPFTNHPLEYYSILSLVADKALERMGGQNVNEFFNLFMEAESQYEFKADGSYQKKTDVRRFRNFRQFRKLLDSHIDFKSNDEGVVRPNRVQQNYEIPQSSFGQEMEASAQELFKDTANAGTLKAIGELRKIAFSPFASRFYTGGPVSYKRFVEESPKIKTLMALIEQNLKDRPDGGQIVYVDDVGVSYLPEMKQYMVKELGLKPEEVEIISGATPKNKRPDIQERFNNGAVKVIIGSEAIKEGMNLQKNTTDMYILSLPWNFTQLRQVIGRAWRQGNRWMNVRVNNLYIQDGIDIFLSQKLDNKQKRYEAALSSGSNVVDVGDVDYQDLKFQLVKDPVTRAKLEISSQKEMLDQKIDQQESELAFVEKKISEGQSLRDERQSLTEFIAREKESLAKETDPQEKNFLEARINRYEKDMKRADRSIKNYAEQLATRSLSEDILSERQKTITQDIEKMKVEKEALKEKFDERVKKIADSMPVPVQFDDSMVRAFAADRAEANKTFYQLREAEGQTDIKPVIEKKEIKNASGTKVVETKKKVTIKRTSRDGKEQDVLRNNSMTVAEKVDALLSVKQEGKEFKDVGERVAGSKKERAAIVAVMESGDGSLMDEMISRLGVETMADVINKDRILENTAKPDPKKDKEDGVPALLAFVKKDIYNKIPKVFSPIQETRRRFGGDGSSIYFREKGGDQEFHRKATKMNGETQGAITEAFNVYPDILREFVSRLSDVKTFEDLSNFWAWYLKEYEEPYEGRPFPMADGGTVMIKGSIFGWSMPDYMMPELPGWNSGSSPIKFISFIDSNKKEGESSDLEYINSEKWWDKAMGTREKNETEIDRSHGNFVPMEHIRRTATKIAEARVKSETLQTDLGFKSVQLGNYMDDVTSKEHIRHTIGAVEDIGMALNIDISKMINDLGLSIAYGARGGGGFLAHYEPARNIINLTKGRGDGSFFHEFVHFMDTSYPKQAKSYRGAWSSMKTKYYGRDLVDKASLDLMQSIFGKHTRKEKEFIPGENDDGASQEVKDMYLKGVTLEDAVKQSDTMSEWQKRSFVQDIADVYRKTVKSEIMVWNEPTNYITESGKIGGNYWTRPEELLARAGQSYIEDKMKEAGLVNDYVTRSTIDNLAYPQGDERVQFNKLFDKLFEALQIKYPRGESTKFKTGSDQKVQTMTEAGSILDDYKKRLGIDFDTHFVDSILVGSDPTIFEKIHGMVQGATLDNTVVLLKNMAKGTVGHEMVHLTLANLEHISAFEGMTRDAILEAQAQDMGISLPGNEVKVEEALASGYEEYVSGKENQGVLARFFAILKKMMMRFLTAVRASKGSIISDYYDVLNEGRSIDRETVRLDNKGIVNAFIEDGSMSIDDLEQVGLSKFDQIEVQDSGIRFKTDKRLSDLEEKFNETTDEATKQQAKIEDWYNELQTTVSSKEIITQDVSETPQEIKQLSKYRKQSPPRELSPRGKEVVSTFSDPKSAIEQMDEYLKRKIQLIETRNKLRQLRQEIAQARKEGRETKTSLRDLNRRLKLRKQILERNDFYIDLGRGRGKKEGIKFVLHRKSALYQIAGTIGLSNEKMRELIGGRHIETMTEADFNDFLIAISNKAQGIKDTNLLHQKAFAIVKNMQLKNIDNLKKAMGLPRLSKMTAEQTTRFIDALSGYRLGDIFLTQREIETIHRTKWGDIKTARELVDKIEDHTGTPRGSFSKLEAPKYEGIWTSWIDLSRRHPFWNWVVNKRFEAMIVSEKEYHAIEEEIFALTNEARKSRSKFLSLKQRLAESIVPTDGIVTGYLESEDKVAYAKENKMTKEELKLSDRLIALYAQAYEYLKSEYGMQGRDNYMTHVRRSFLETVKDEGMKSALKEVFDSQKEHEAQFNILDSQTGKILAFEKYMGYMQQRKDVIVPSKNIARSTSAYFRILTKKKALDAFVPEVMIAVHAHNLITASALGETEKGLSKDPALETFVKTWLNDAKGRRITVLGLTQGSKLDIGIKAAMTSVRLYYLGFNPISGFINIVGDMVAISRGLTLKEKGQGIYRTILNPRKSMKVNKAFEGYLGKNPFWELANPDKNLPARIMDLSMILFGITSYASEKFYLRSKLTSEEFKNMVASDTKMVEITRELSKWKKTKFFIPSLIGSTTFNKARMQFSEWAVPIWDTTFSDIKGVLREWNNGGFKNMVESEQAKSLVKTGIYIGITVTIAALIGPPPDDDKSIWGKSRRKFYGEFKTLAQALTQVTDFSHYFLIVQKLTELQSVMRLLITQEQYQSDGLGFVRGESKWINAFEKFATPSSIQLLFPPKQQRSSRDELIEEAARTGELDAASIGQFLNPDKWEETGDSAEQYKQRTIDRLTIEYNVARKYPNSKVAEAIKDNAKIADRVSALLNLANDVGIDQVLSEVNSIFEDEETGNFISQNLYDAFEEAVDQYQR